MDKTNFKVLTEKEMSQISGGKWIVVEGKWIWVSVQKDEEDVLLEDSVFHNSK